MLQRLYQYMPFYFKAVSSTEGLSYQDNNLISWQFNMRRRVLYKMRLNGGEEFIKKAKVPFVNENVNIIFEKLKLFHVLFFFEKWIPNAQDKTAWLLSLKYKWMLQRLYSVKVNSTFPTTATWQAGNTASESDSIIAVEYIILECILLSLALCLLDEEFSSSWYPTLNKFTKLQITQICVFLSLI